MTDSSSPQAFDAAVVSATRTLDRFVSSQPALVSTLRSDMSTAPNAALAGFVSHPALPRIRAAILMGVKASENPQMLTAVLSAAAAIEEAGKRHKAGTLPACFTANDGGKGMDALISSPESLAEIEAWIPTVTQQHAPGAAAAGSPNRTLH